MRACVEDFSVHIHSHGCGTAVAALRTEWVVSGVVDVVASPMDRSTGVLAWYQGGKPAAGYSLGKRGAGEQTSYNLFPNAITNACSIGKYLQDTLGNLFISGDSEYCTGQGLLMEAGANNDLFIKANFEVNGSDISCGGYCSEFHGCDSTTATFGPTAKFVELFGGNWDALSILSGALLTGLNGVRYSRGLGAATLTDAGTKTRPNSVIDMANQTVGNAKKGVTALTVTTPSFTYTNNTGNVVGLHVVGGTVGSMTLFESGQSMVQPTPGATTGVVVMIQPAGQVNISSSVAPTAKLITGY